MKDAPKVLVLAGCLLIAGCNPGPPSEEELRKLLAKEMEEVHGRALANGPPIVVWGQLWASFHLTKCDEPTGGTYKCFVTFADPKGTGVLEYVATVQRGKSWWLREAVRLDK